MTDADSLREIGKLMKRVKDLERERDQVRNTALDDAIEALNDMWIPGERHPIGEIKAVIRALKSPTPGGLKGNKA